MLVDFLTPNLPCNTNKVDENNGQAPTTKHVALF